MCHCLVDKTLEQIVPEVFGAGSRLPEGRNQRSQLDGKEVVPKYLLHPRDAKSTLTSRFTGLYQKWPFRETKPPKKPEPGNLLLFYESP